MMNESNDLEATANSSESSEDTRIYAKEQTSRFKSKESSKGKMIRKKLEQFKRKAAVKNMKSPNRLGESSNLEATDESCESSGDYSSHAEMQPSKNSKVVINASKKCSKKHGREMQRRVQSAAKMMIPEVAAKQQISESLRIKVLSRMISDEISLEVKKDSDILIYGSRLLRNHPEEHQALLVSQKMRDMAKLVIAARERDSSITGIRQCIDNAKFDTVVASVRAVAGYSSQLESYEVPSYARNIGFEIDKVIAQLCSEALKSSDNSLADKVKTSRISSWHHGLMKLLMSHIIH
ncbi:hypothetical protein BSL78_27154 [Apostichopus japonicus]|uniref:Uncharacterized protein n=1 Tax=Stichopus japonicus TaxID=307972 RepID=A0A2G8JJW4_STIJA|nr:hypothetical protein BSL78_27154 [Apostichopus japonicus]